MLQICYSIASGNLGLTTTERERQNYHKIFHSKQANRGNLTKDIGIYIYIKNYPVMTKLKFGYFETLLGWFVVSMFSKVSKVENVETWKLFKWQNFWSQTNIKSTIQTLNMKLVLSGQFFKDSYHKSVFQFLNIHNEGSQILALVKLAKKNCESIHQYTCKV